MTVFIKHRTLIEHLDRAADKERKAAGMDALARHAEAIREHLWRGSHEFIKAGERLTAARKICGHGEWLPWLKREFAWASDDTARNLMNLYKWSEADSERVRNLELHLPWRSIYLLARPSTAEAARREVFERVERGEPPSHAQVKAAVEKARLPARAPTYNVVPEPPTQIDREEAYVDQFKQFDRHAQNRILRRLLQIARGGA